MTDVCIPVSIGELVDKYSILEIKEKYIVNSSDIKNEMNKISISKKYIDAYPRFYKQLVYINKKIWDLTDEIKQTNICEVQKYSTIASEIFSFNQKRFRLKKYFNELNNSSIREHKSYSEDICVVHANNIIGKLDTVGFLCVEYDTVYLHIHSEDEEHEIRNILPNPNLCFFMGEFPPYTTFYLDTTAFVIPEVFKFTPINYCATGLLGDFILQLSVVCENFYKTGQKGIVNMIDSIPFRQSIKDTYRDIEFIIKSQPYIEDLRIGAPEDFDIYLSSWRNSEQLYQINMYDLFLQEYDIQMGKHQWIYAENDSQWNSKIVIHITQYRFPNSVNYSSIISQYGIENIIFLNMENNDFEYFVERTGIVIPNVYTPRSFEELCIIINSCKLFIGAASMPLCIANATHVDRIVGLPSDSKDIKMITGLINHIPNILFEI